MGQTVSSGEVYHVSAQDTGDIVLNSGTMFVDSGGTATSTTVNAGGSLSIENGGTDSATALSGLETVNGGGVDIRQRDQRECRVDLHRQFRR